MIKELATDTKGNKLIYHQVNTVNGLMRFIKLHLTGQHPRLLADIFRSSKHTGFTLKIIRNRKKHLFRKNQSYGFNDVMIKKCIDVDIKNVVFIDDIGRYDFPLQLIIDKGEYLHFQQQGFERQLFLSLEEIEKHRTDIENKSLFD